MIRNEKRNGHFVFTKMIKPHLIVLLLKIEYVAVSSVWSYKSTKFFGMRSLVN